MKTIEDISCKGKKVLIRVDFNVPRNENGEVTDKTRIQAAVPTIIKVLKDGGCAILVSHMGRPGGKIDMQYSLSHIQSAVSDVLGIDIIQAKDIVGTDAKAKAEALRPGEVLMLENVRFNPGEEEGNELFAKELSTVADVYINDAFGTAHRAHASTTTVAKFFEEKGFGYLMAKELTAIEKVLKSGEKPVLGILGGAKVSSKITIIENLLAAVDELIIAGGMAYTFVKAQGGNIGDSLVENDKLDLALEILVAAKENNVNVHLPVDSVVGNDFNEHAEMKVEYTNAISPGWQGLDIGPESIAKFGKVVEMSKTILWNGPMGVFEFDRFAAGTIALGKAIGAATNKGSFSLVGGGDSVSAVKKFGLEKSVSYVSTGGGAMLESLEGKTLPGVAAILD